MRIRRPSLPTGPIAPGATVTARTLTPVTGPEVAVPDPERLAHLQFRRFAGCPVCHLHLRSVVRRHAEIEAAGVREVVLFHSSARELRKHTADLPFAVVADPGKRLYAEFGVESAPRSLLGPRVWGAVLRAVLRSAWMIARGREHGPGGRPEGGRLGLPADFLIAPDGRVVAAKYGAHAYDQWSVDELLELARQAPRTAPAAG
jgi:peroxiredoxin